MKYIPSIAFEEMSGSSKGVTATKIKNRKHIRNRGYGGSVRTSDQAKVKGVFKRLTTMWKTLANDNILAWNKLVLSQQGRSVLGTGANLFTRLNSWIVACGGQPVLVPSWAWRTLPPPPSRARVTPAPSNSTRPSPTTAASSWSSKPPKASPTVSPVPTARPPASSSLRNTPQLPSTSVPTTWPRTVLPALPPRRSSSATTSTAPPVRSLASCWLKPPGPLLPQVASLSTSPPRFVRLNLNRLPSAVARLRRAFDIF